MTDQENRSILAKGWMAKADEAFHAAECLLQEKSLTGCVNRLYYAVFYAVSAVLASEGHEYGKHSAVRAALHRDFVKTKRVSVACSETYDELFEDRQAGDYTPETFFTFDDVSRLSTEARKFIDNFKVLLR
jgi:uncharacterized protein